MSSFATFIYQRVFFRKLNITGSTNSLVCSEIKNPFQNSDSAIDPTYTPRNDSDLSSSD